MKTHAADTIVACSTPAPAVAASESAPRDVSRAIIRISGSRAFEIAGSVFESENKASLAGEDRSWCRVNGSVVWRSHTVPAHAYRMPAPHSFTREDIVELHVQGIPWLIGDLIDRLIAHGARMAQPG